MGTNTSSVVDQPKVVEAQDSITRLANATQYVVGDCMSDHATVPTAAGYFTLPLASRPGGSVKIIDATLHKTDVDATAADFTIMLFDTPPAVAGIKDGEPCAITDAEFKTMKGMIKFANGSWSDVKTGNIQEQGELRRGFVCASGEVNVYGIVLLEGTYTPASGEVFTLTVHAEQY